MPCELIPVDRGPELRGVAAPLLPTLGVAVAFGVPLADPRGGVGASRGVPICLDPPPGGDGRRLDSGPSGASTGGLGGSLDSCSLLTSAGRKLWPAFAAARFWFWTEFLAKAS